ncbi:MAG: hypothetical protein V9G14_13710 [Cypionkella sp.]
MPPSPMAVAHVDERAAFLSEGCARIFGYAETAWREYQSVAWYVKTLRGEGFTR